MYQVGHCLRPQRVVVPDDDDDDDDDDNDDDVCVCVTECDQGQQ